MSTHRNSLNTYQVRNKEGFSQIVKNISFLIFAMVINYNISQAQATVQNHEDINPTTERANKNGNIAIIFNQKKILLPKKEIVKNKKSQKQREERKDIFGIDHLAEQSKVLSQKIIGQM